jgi:ribosomal protein S5
MADRHTLMRRWIVNVKAAHPMVDGGQPLAFEAEVVVFETEANIHRAGQAAARVMFPASWAGRITLRRRSSTASGSSIPTTSARAFDNIAGL